MSDQRMPKTFQILLSQNCINDSHICKTSDGFYFANQSLSNILAEKEIFDFKDTCGDRFLCRLFYDDWYLYAVPFEDDFVYGLLKMREQEFDAKDGSPADGDTPGVTVSFIAFDDAFLIQCLSKPTDENRTKLNDEIDRVVAARGQRHHPVLKRYFKNPQSQGSYLVAFLYTRYIASRVENGRLALPEQYKSIVQQSISYPNSPKLARLVRFMESLNHKAGCTICDDEYIFIQNPLELTVYEAAAILAAHTGNTSVYSFAAEVEYHARFLNLPARIKIPFFGRSIYDSAIRADMTVGDTEFEGPAPFHKQDSKIVKRQYEIHHNKRF